ncbi:D-ribose pyranase [Psychromonas arctica]|uniref:D-ribose pyranase n=1 Tax=Psychromonas arctica TaxID=168275 RepID=UPI002FD464A9
MKKSALLNAKLSHCIASLGHFDEITICDAGLPIPIQVERIDLALTHGVPSLLETIEVVLSEMQITGAIIAEEMKMISPELHDALLAAIKKYQAIDITYVSHDTFKVKTIDSKAIVRTGECTPYANVIFQSGVVF